MTFGDYLTGRGWLARRKRAAATFEHAPHALKDRLHAVPEIGEHVDFIVGVAAPPPGFPGEAHWVMGERMFPEMWIGPLSVFVLTADLAVRRAADLIEPPERWGGPALDQWRAERAQTEETA